MPVQLPDDLVIAAGRIEIRHLAPEEPRRDPVVDGIAVPVDPGGVAARGREPQVAVAEQVEAAVGDRVGAPHGLGGGVGKTIADRAAHRARASPASPASAAGAGEVAGEGAVGVVDPAGRQVGDGGADLGGATGRARRPDPRAATPPAGPGAPAAPLRGGPCRPGDRGSPPPASRRRVGAGGPRASRRFGGGDGGQRRPDQPRVGRRPSDRAPHPRRRRRSRAGRRRPGDRRAPARRAAGTPGRRWRRRRRAARAGRARRGSASRARRRHRSTRPAGRSRTPRAPRAACCRRPASARRRRRRRSSAPCRPARPGRRRSRRAGRASAASARSAGSCPPDPTTVSVASGWRAWTRREGPQRAGHVVVRLEVAGREQARPQPLAARGSGSARDR